MIKNISFVQSNGYEQTTSCLLMMDALSTESKKSWLRKCMQLSGPHDNVVETRKYLLKGQAQNIVVACFLVGSCAYIAA
jgi:hypothetical protein